MQRLIRWLNLWTPGDFTQPAEQLPLSERIRRALVAFILGVIARSRLRYLAIERILRRMKAQHFPILEVGASSLGLAYHLRASIVSVDLDFPAPRLLRHVHCVNGSAASLPIKDAAFMTVVSTDMLEHIPRPHRPQVVRELLRVAKGTLVLATPCSPVAERWESKMRAYVEARSKSLPGGPDALERFLNRADFLVEHERYGVPTEDEVAGLLKEALVAQGRRATWRVINNEGGWVWYFTTRAMLKDRALFMVPGYLALLAFRRLLLCMPWGGWYRKIFVVTLRGAGDA